MMNKRSLFRISLVFTVLLFAANHLKAQLPPFWNEIQAFKKQDSVSAPPKNAILFVGSSSFNFWKDVQLYFPNYPIINRGFGGSTLCDVIRYTEDIIYPYHPKQIVIYCGENDLAGKASPQTVFVRFRKLYRMIRNHLGDVSIAYVSIKPSPSRQNLMPEMEKANALIMNFLEKQENSAFIDVYHQMLNTDGEPIKEIFTKDDLHMNAKGYAIWQRAIQPFLVK